MEDQSLDGDWKVPPVIRVRPPAWRLFPFVYFVYFVVAAA
jgi:hypothetical protein